MRPVSSLRCGPSIVIIVVSHLHTKTFCYGSWFRYHRLIQQSRLLSFNSSHVILATSGSTPSCLGLFSKLLSLSTVLNGLPIRHVCSTGWRLSRSAVSRGSRSISACRKRVNCSAKTQKNITRARIVQILPSWCQSTVRTISVTCLPPCPKVYPL